jgi:curved DNA-binding protein CbpA
MKCKLLSQRYEILSDPQSRETYDHRGLDGLTGGGGGMHGMDPADIFAQFFGESMSPFGPGAGRRRGKGEDSVIPYEVSLEDLYNSKTVRMNMEKQAVCGQCKGYHISLKFLSRHVLIPSQLALELVVMPSLNLARHVKGRGGILFILKFASVSVGRL